MTYRGRVKNGTVVFDEPVSLPEGSPVEVIVRGAQLEEECIPTLYERLKPVIGKAEGLPPDSSVNVDHYLYGHPKV